MPLSLLRPRIIVKEGVHAENTKGDRVLGSAMHPRSRERRFRFVVSVFLSLGLLTALHLGLLWRAESRAALLSLERNAAFNLPLQSSVTDSEREMFLQALLKLPQVRSIDIQGPIRVTLRSILDYETFFTFLRRSELSSILSPSLSSELPQARDGIVASMEEESRRTSLAAVFSLGAALLLFAFLLLTMQSAPLSKEARLLRLFGATHGRQLRPFFREGGTHLAAAFLFSIPVAAILLISLRMTMPSMNLVLPTLLGEGIILSVLLFLAAECSLSSLFRNSWDA